MTAPKDPDVVFVVGVARSGTTLMRSVLDASSQIAIAPETHFMGHYLGRWGARHAFRPEGDLHDDATVRRIVDLIYSGKYARRARWRAVSQYWKWLVANVTRDEFERALLASERTERGLFAALLRLYADRKGKPIMGEKTPTHLNQVPTLVRWFPGARVVHVLRDPRAIYVSDRHRRQESPRRLFKWLDAVPLLLESLLMVQTVLSWRSAMSQHVRYARTFPDNYRLFRFEDVVLRPDTTLAEVFAFVGAPTPAIESVSVNVGHGMHTRASGIDPGAADRWRSQLNPLANRLVSLSLHGGMRRYGYLD